METKRGNTLNLSDEEPRLGKFPATESRLTASSACREGGMVNYCLMIAKFLFGSMRLTVIMVEQYGNLYTWQCWKQWVLFKLHSALVLPWHSTATCKQLPLILPLPVGTLIQSANDDILSPSAPLEAGVSGLEVSMWLLYTGCCAGSTDAEFPGWFFLPKLFSLLQITGRLISTNLIPRADTQTHLSPPSWSILHSTVRVIFLKWQWRARGVAQG